MPDLSKRYHKQCPDCGQWFTGYRSALTCLTCRDTHYSQTRRRNSKRQSAQTRTAYLRGSSERKCMMCGRDPWPNWFYCPSCHGYATNRLGIDTENVFGV